MQGGGEEELLRFTADTSGVIGPLEQVVAGLDAVDQGVNKLAGGFQILDADALGIGKIREMLYGVGQAAGEDVIKVEELGQAFKDMMAGQDLTKALGLDQLAAMSQSASGRVAELSSQMSRLADENKLVADSWLAEENAMAGLDRAYSLTTADAQALTDGLALTSGMFNEMGGRVLDANLALRQYEEGALIAAQSTGLADEAITKLYFDMNEVKTATKQAGDSLLTAGDAVRSVGSDVLIMGADIERGISSAFLTGKVSIDSMKTALQDMAAAGTLSADELAAALRLVEQLWVGVSAATTQAVAPAKEAANTFSIEATSVQDLATQLSKLNAAFASNVFDKSAFTAEGLAAKDLAAGLTELIAKADSFAAAQAVLISSANGDAAALEKVNAAALMAAKGMSEATLATSDSATKMVASANAASGAASAHRNLIDTLAQVVNEYIALAMVIQMAASAIGNFVSQGMQIEHTMNIIQGATQATDTQMQQWSASMDQFGLKFGILQSEAAPALDLITRGGFEGAGATTVMSNAMELANTTGSKMADTTALLTTALNVYGLGADQAHMVTQNLYSAFESSTLSMSQFDSFLQTSGLDAKNLGISIQDLLSTFGEVGNKIGGGNIALREFQAILGGLTTFSNLTDAQLTKLANGFDLTKFAAADASLKMLDLAKAANGNEAAFTKMLGGMGNAQAVIDGLGISTHQLAVNAANLGLSFDPVIYNSLDAAGKLQYLAGVADYTDSRFKALTKGGLESVNAALVGILPAIDAAGKHLADTSGEFDMAKFKSEDLAQKLHQLADFVGGTGTQAFATYVGGVKNVGPAIAIMNTEVDSTGQHMSAAATNVARANDTMRTHVDTTSRSFKDMDSAAGKTSMDAQTQSQAIGSAWQHLSDNFVRTYGPNIASGLQSIATGIDQLANGGQTTKAEDNIKGLYKEFGAPLPQPTTADEFTNNLIANSAAWQAQMDQEMGTTLPAIVRRHAPAMYQASLDYLHQATFAQIASDAEWKAYMDKVMGTDIPSTIRRHAPDAYQAELDYLHQLAKPDPGWEAGIRSEVDSTFAKNIPLLIRSKGPAAYQAELDYLHQLAHPDSGWESGVRSEVDSTFSKDVPGIMRNAAPGAHQAELDYLHQLANPPTSWENDIKNQVDDLFGNNIPAKIRNHAPDAYQATLDYLHQMSTGASTGNQQIVDNTGKTYRDDVPAAISSGQGPSDTAVKKITDGQSRAWKQLHTDLVGSSIVPDMMTAITAAIAAGVGPSSAAAKLVTAAVDTVFVNEAAPAYKDGLAVGNQFAAGITAAQPAAVAAATATAQAVANILAHHSPPKEGPMHDDDTWGSNFMVSFVSGITGSIGKLQNASMLAAQTVGSNMNLASPSNMGTGGSMSLATTNNLLRQLISQHVSSPINSGPQGTVTQNFGALNFSGINNVNDLQRQLNMLAGKSYEDSLRGATAGSGW